jgi:hypothetical protein
MVHLVPEFLAMHVGDLIRFLGLLAGSFISSGKGNKEVFIEK